MKQNCIEKSALSVLYNTANPINIVDLQDFTIWWVNKASKFLFGDRTGEKCFKALYDSSTMCRDCLILDPSFMETGEEEDVLEVNKTVFGRTFKVRLYRISNDDGEVFAVTHEFEDVTSLNTDKLTGVLNRRGIDSVLKTEIARSRRDRNYSFAGLLLDMDNLKAINDTKGHLKGDQALQNLSSLFCRITREEDSIGRNGGDEFLIIAPNIKDYLVLYAFAEKLREAAEKEARSTISIGAGIWDRKMTTIEEFIEKLDIALYESKNNGKNQVSLIR